jgi:ATP-dependent Zn protease
MPNDPQQAMEFAQSKGQARKEGRTNIRFKDVAGAGQTLKDLQDVVEVWEG